MLICVFTCIIDLPTRSTFQFSLLVLFEFSLFFIKRSWHQNIRHQIPEFMPPLENNSPSLKKNQEYL